MSLALMQKVWDSRLNESNKMVMLVLASDANDDGYGVLSDMQDVLQRTSMSEDEICREFSQLNAAGVIQLERRPGFPETLYKINCDHLRQLRRNPAKGKPAMAAAGAQL